ncbi:DUF1643 domain-containing protein [Microbacterium sp. R86528]|uniref:DUF1643 domain-containing protein n=1 Tax=Microbacterium sp. R86528 TaxID=3093864 RepID=UPI0037C8C3F5
MTERWIYEHTADGSARFVLGTVGTNPLVCFGINPSTARPGGLDNTVTQVAKFAATNGFDSWIMLNVYPQISTDPKGLHLQHRPDLKAENERQIAQIVQGRATLLAAWGNNIDRRPYLRELLGDIVGVTTAAGTQWVSLGELTKAGNPWHPLYRSGRTPLVSFNMARYMAVQ